jgi:hypothetical protein
MDHAVPPEVALIVPSWELPARTRASLLRVYFGETDWEARIRILIPVPGAGLGPEDVRIFFVEFLFLGNFLNSAVRKK